MAYVHEIRKALFDAAPKAMKMDWDNVGLMCGHPGREVTRVMIALDASMDVLEEASGAGCELVVSHHPMIFGGTKTVTDETVTGRALLFAIENGIAVISMHTNLDCAPGGVNDVLAERLELEAVRVLHPNGEDASGRPYGLIRVGETAETDVRTFAGFVQAKLNCPGLRFADAGKPVRLVAVGGGGCGSEIDAVLAAGCDTFVTADLKYHQLEEARWHGLNLIDAGHFETEDPVCTVLTALLRTHFPELRVLKSAVHHDEIQFSVQ